MVDDSFNQRGIVEIVRVYVVAVDLVIEMEGFGIYGTRIIPFDGADPVLAFKRM